MKMKTTLIFLLTMSFSIFGMSQDTTNWKLYPSNTDTILPTDTVYGFKKSTKVGVVKVEKDKRIDGVSEEMKGGTTGKPKIMYEL